MFPDGSIPGPHPITLSAITAQHITRIQELFKYLSFRYETGDERLSVFETVAKEYGAALKQTTKLSPELYDSYTKNGVRIEEYFHERLLELIGQFILTLCESVDPESSLETLGSMELELPKNRLGEAKQYRNAILGIAQSLECVRQEVLKEKNRTELNAARDCAQKAFNCKKHFMAAPKNAEEKRHHDCGLCLSMMVLMFPFD